MSLAPLTNAGGVIQIQPVHLVLDKKTGRTNRFVIINRSDSVVAMQIRAYAWAQASDGSDVLTPATQLFHTPSIVRIEPTSRQTVRFTLAPDTTLDAGREIHFRIVVEELPPEDPKKGVLVRMRYVMPLFVGGEAAINHSESVDMRVLATRTDCRVQLHHQGGRHLRVERLSLGSADNRVNVKTPRYVLPGSTLLLPCPAEAIDSHYGKSLRLETESTVFESVDPALDADLAVGSVAR